MSDTPAKDPALDTCGCCDEPTDPPRANRPGLPAIRWRPGTWSTIYARLKDGLSTVQIPDGPNAGTRPLAALTARADDDPAIAWLDACAVVGEILSFYQERIANEGFLRTATERRSVLELARQIGYELGPGVAASTSLAFTLDAPLAQVPGMPSTTPERLALVVGTQVKSMPASGQLPQTFETIEPITAAVAFNSIALRSLQRHTVMISSGALYWLQPDKGVGGSASLVDALWVQGTATNVRVGDLLVVRVSSANRLDGDPASERATAGAAQAIPLWVTSVSADFAAARTRLGVLQAEDTPPPFAQASQSAGKPTIDPVPLDVEHARDVIMSHDWAESDLAAMIAVQKWDGDELLDKVDAALAAEPPPYDLFVFRTKTGVFGHNAPASATLVKSGFTDYDKYATTIWTDELDVTWTSDGYDADLFLDRVVDGLLPGGFVAIAPAPGTPSTPTIIMMKPGHIVAKKKLLAKSAIAKKAVQHAGAGGKTAPPAMSAPAKRPPATPAPVTPDLYLIAGLHEASLGQFAISAKATGLRLDASVLPSDSPNLLSDDDKSSSLYRRNTTVWSASEALVVADAPIADVVWNWQASHPAGGLGATDVWLDRMVLGLAIGQSIALTGITATIVDDPAGPGGKSAQPTGVEAREIVALAGIFHARGRTRLVLQTPLEHAYMRSTVTINANVAEATHGETVSREVLGNGDGSRANQTFTLAKSPLTYVSAPTPSGGQSSLTIEVNGVYWKELPSLYSAGPTDRVYMIRRNDDGTSSVTFGDGERGARLPTGAANVLATYRTGTGLAGDLDKDKLTLLSSRPLGLKSVTNPLPATGAAAPEELADARVNAPRTVRTLDRVVSIDDYQDFARSFLGIGKAQAMAIWSGQRLVVQITIASAAGTAVDPETPLYQNLCAAIIAASDGGHAVYVDSFRPIFFKLDVKLAIAADYDQAPVVAAVTAALQSAFAFAARDFAQPVSTSEIIAVIQPIAGVVAVNVRQLYFATDAPAANALLTAEPARWTGDQRLAAQLLLLHPVGLTIEAVTA